MQSSHIVTLQQNIETQMKNQDTEGPKSALFLNHPSENAYEQSLALIGSQFQKFQNQVTILNQKIKFLMQQKQKSMFYSQNKVDGLHLDKAYQTKRLDLILIKSPKK